MRGWRGRQPRTIFELCRWFAETPNHRHLTYTKKIIRHSFVPFPEQRGKRGKKSYRSRIVLIDGIITADALEKLCNGVEIGIHNEKYITLPCKAFVLDNDPDIAPRKKRIRDNRHGPVQWISITISEGKYRQVRKMTAAVGFPTLRLVRVRIANMHLNNLKAGEVIEVEKFDY